MALQIGDAFQKHNPTASDHVYFICSTRSAAGTVVWINMTSVRSYTIDFACRLKVGDHRSVEHDSVMYYAGAGLVSLERLEWRVFTAKDLLRLPTASDQLLQRIRQGAIDSAYTPDEVRDAIEACPWAPKAGA